MKMYWRLMSLALALVFTSPLYAQSMEWDSADWGSSWQEGGNSDFLDTDGDQLLNRDDTDDDGDGIPDDVEIEAGLNPLLASDANQDADGDGLTNLEEYRLGTDINNNDSDGDGIADGQDSNPLVADTGEVLSLLEVLVLDDMDADGVPDIAQLSTAQGETESRVSLFSGIDMSLINSFSLEIGLDVEEVRVHVDVNDNGAQEIGIFGIRTDAGNEGKPQYKLYDTVIGGVVRSYNWPANWQGMSLLVLDDITGDGLPDVGMQGENLNNGRPQLLVRDGADGSAVDTFSYPAIFIGPEYVQLSDINGDGFDDIGLSGNLARNGKPQIRAVDATDKSNRFRSFNFANNWDDTSWHRLSDITSDGVDDWGLFGIRKDDGRPQLLNKRGNDARGMLQIFAWPGDMSNAVFRRVPDMNFDNVDEVAAFGLRDNNRYQLSVKDGADRSVMLANYGWPNNWSNVTVEILSDLNADGVVEVALFGQNSSDEWELIIKDGSSRAEFDRYNLGSDWLERPTLMLPGDLNDDELNDLLVSGLSSGNQASVLRLFSQN